MKAASIADLAEDLWDEPSSKQNHRAQKPKPITSIANPKCFDDVPALEQLVTEVASALEVVSDELTHWMSRTSIPADVMKTILLTAKRLKLNPLLGHIAWEFNDENQWEIYIPIDGWIALIHQKPTFQGITFDQATELENSVPIWMECTIYRDDLAHPITVREYVAELKTDHPMWTQMPRRMLRHKTLQQCARLAFGICESGLITAITNINSSEKDIFTKHKTLQPKEMLKKKLMSNSTSAL
jgi:hypothetical protein